METITAYTHSSSPGEGGGGRADAHKPTENVIDTMQRFAGFASIMRSTGALVIVAAMSLFLMQGWQEGDDISRYYMLLAQTGLLAAGGFGLSFLFKENKGARVFFGLGLVSVTVNMTTLGALVFSLTQWGSSLVSYPDFAQWQTVGPDSLALAFGATLLCSLPVSLFSYKVFARRSAVTLAVVFLAMNLLLLLPVRESWMVGLVAMAAILMPYMCMHKRISEDMTLRTPEGIFAMLSLLVPGGIIIFRSLWLYPLDDMLTLLLSGTAYMALRFAAMQAGEGPVVRPLINSLSLAAAFSSACACAALAEHILPGALVIAAFTIPFCALTLEVATRSSKPGGYASFAMVTLASIHGLLALIEGGMLSGVMCMVAGAAIIAIGAWYGLRFGFFLGGITVLAGLAVQFSELLQRIDLSDWLTLSVTGAIIIILASLIERHGAYIKLRLDRMQTLQKAS